MANTSLLQVRTLAEDKEKASLARLEGELKSNAGWVSLDYAKRM